MAKFDFGGQQSYKDRAQAQAKNTSLPSLAHDAAIRAAKSGVFLDTISIFFETKSVTPQQAVDSLVSGLQNAE